MGNESGTWIMYGVSREDPECIHTVDEAVEYINKVGFLPLFKNEIPGFSLEERTAPEYWWSGDAKSDPWEWREIAMDREKWSQASWLDLATSGIRFGPDRRMVAEELAAHLEDKAADLRRIFPDMTEKEAWERAVSEMGDPAEIGKELAKIHRPWLGYLWRASQAALAAALLVLLVLVGSHVIGGSSTLGGWYGREGSRRDSQDGIILLAAEEETVELEGCTLSLDHTVLWSGPDGERSMELCLRVDSLRFWEKGSCQFEHITATDDLGSHYASEYEWSVKAVPFRRHIYTYLDGWGPFHQSYRVQVRGIAPEAEWIRLEYRLLGRSFSLNIDLTKEAEA